MKKLLSVLSSIGLTMSSITLVAACSNKTSKQGIIQIDSSEVESTNNGGGFKFTVNGVLVNDRISDGGKLSEYFSCFNDKNEKLVTDVRDLDKNRDWYKGKKYNFVVTVYLFDNGGHDENVHENIKFCSTEKSGNVIKVLANVRIDHNKIPDKPFQITNARIVYEGPDNSGIPYKSFKIIPAVDTPYGAYDKNMQLQANLKTVDSNSISHPKISSFDIKNNGWEIDVFLEKPIIQTNNKQVLTFSVNASKDTIASTSSKFIVPNLAPTIKVEGTMSNMDNPIEIQVSYSNIDDFDDSKFKAYIGSPNKMIEVKIIKLDVKPAYIVMWLDHDPIDWSTSENNIKVEYYASDGSIASSVYSPGN